MYFHVFSSITLISHQNVTCFPTIEVFLAKKNRLNGLKTICFEYVQSMYYTQSITPVTVRVAQRLTEPQMEKVKEKMKQKAGTKDTTLLDFFEGTYPTKKPIGQLGTSWVLKCM